MISKEELISYARLSNLNLGQAEKDYFQNVVLFILYQEYGNEIVFKGGTALKKCYGLGRFSEDLDFTCSKKIGIKKVEYGLKRFRIDFEVKKEEFENSLKVILNIKGPLYIGIRASLCRLVIDFSFRENVLLQPVIKTIGRFLEEIPSFDVFVMQELEILAEKVRAMLSRTKARDVYDVWFLLAKGTEFDKGIIEKKLLYYNQRWNKDEFKKRLSLNEKIWETELLPLVGSLPKFIIVKRLILGKLW